MLAELIFEIIFSPIGYIYLRYMEKKQIGKEYLDLYQIELKDMTNEEAKQNNDELAAKLNENNKNDNNENSNNLEWGKINNILDISIKKRFLYLIL